VSNVPTSTSILYTHIWYVFRWKVHCVILVIACQSPPTHLNLFPGIFLRLFHRERTTYKFPCTLLKEAAEFACPAAPGPASSSTMHSKQQPRHSMHTSKVGAVGDESSPETHIAIHCIETSVDLCRDCEIYLVLPKKSLDILGTCPWVTQILKYAM
jgi:hypothetical protein